MSTLIFLHFKPNIRPIIFTVALIFFFSPFGFAAPPSAAQSNDVEKCQDMFKVPGTITHDIAATNACVSFLRALANSGSTINEEGTSELLRGVVVTTQEELEAEIEEAPTNEHDRAKIIIVRQSVGSASSTPFMISSPSLANRAVAIIGENNIEDEYPVISFSDQSATSSPTSSEPTSLIQLASSSGNQQTSFFSHRIKWDLTLEEGGTIISHTGTESFPGKVWIRNCLFTSNANNSSNSFIDLQSMSGAIDISSNRFDISGIDETAIYLEAATTSATANIVGNTFSGVTQSRRKRTAEEVKNSRPSTDFRNVDRLSKREADTPPDIIDIRQFSQFNINDNRQESGSAAAIHAELRGDGSTHDSTIIDNHALCTTENESARTIYLSIAESSTTSGQDITSTPNTVINRIIEESECNVSSCEPITTSRQNSPPTTSTSTQLMIRSNMYYCIDDDFPSSAPTETSTATSTLFTTETSNATTAENIFITGASKDNISIYTYLTPTALTAGALILTITASYAIVGTARKMGSERAGKAFYYMTFGLIKTLKSLEQTTVEQTDSTPETFVDLNQNPLYVSHDTVNSPIYEEIKDTTDIAVITTTTNTAYATTPITSHP